MNFLMPYKDNKNFQGNRPAALSQAGRGEIQAAWIWSIQIEGDPSLSAEDLDRIEGWITKYDFPVKVIRALKEAIRIWIGVVR